MDDQYVQLKRSVLETSEFLDDVLEYFQENDNERARDFEAWKLKRESQICETEMTQRR